MREAEDDGTQIEKRASYFDQAMERDDQQRGEWTNSKAPLRYRPINSEGGGASTDMDYAKRDSEYPRAESARNMEFLLERLAQEYSKGALETPRQD